MDLFDRVHEMVGKLPNLRILELLIDEPHMNRSDWWSRLPATTPAAGTRRGYLEEFVLDGFHFSAVSLDPVGGFRSLDWGHLKRLEIAYPPCGLFAELTGRLPHLRCFRTGPLLGQADFDDLERFWSEDLRDFIDSLIDLEELGITTGNKQLPLPTIGKHRRSLKRLRIHRLKECLLGCPQSWPAGSKWLAKLSRICPRVEELALDVDCVPRWVRFPTHTGPNPPMPVMVDVTLQNPRVLDALARFPSVRRFELVAKNCLFDICLPPNASNRHAMDAFKHLQARESKVVLESLDLRFGIWHALPGYLEAEQRRSRELRFHAWTDERGKVRAIEESERREHEAAKEFHQLMQEDEDRRRGSKTMEKEKEKERKKDQRKRTRKVGMPKTMMGLGGWSKSRLIS